MPVARRLKQMFEAEGVAYRSIPHKPAHTAQTLAAAEHVSGLQHAKAVILRAGDDLAMFVVPACYDLDLNAAAAALGREVSLADEPDFMDRFPDCQLGAIPPFGHLYEMSTWVDESLARENEITFPAGAFRESLTVQWDEYERLAQPRLGKFHLGRPAPGAVDGP